MSDTATADLNGRAYAEFKYVKAGDRLELDDSFTCVQRSTNGPAIVEVKQDKNGFRYFNCSNGEHYLTENAAGFLVGMYPHWIRNPLGQFASPAADEFSGKVIPISSANPVPLEPERAMSIENETPLPTEEDANRIVSMFQSAANAVVNASKFAKELAALRVQFDELRKEIEVYRTTNARLDEEVSRLRTERVDLQRENASLRAEIEETRVNLVATGTRLDATTRERDDWHNRFIETSSQNDTFRRERDDAQYKVVELTDQMEALKREVERWKSSSDDAYNRLNEVTRVVTGTRAA